MFLGIALLGAGRIGRVHAKAITTNPDARLVAVVDAFDTAAKSISDRYSYDIRAIKNILATG